jgi:hypothetical protein
MPRTPSPEREAFWRQLITHHASSRRTVGELCRQAGASTASFYAWRQRLKSRGVVATPSSLVPVRIVADRGGGEITVEFADASTPTPAIRVSIPPGCDEASIRRVLGAVINARAGGRTSC